MRFLFILLLLTKAAFGFTFMRGDGLVSQSEAIAVVNITNTGVKPDHWEFTLDPKQIPSPATISTGTVESCLKGALPRSLTVTEGLTPEKWLLFFKRKNGELTVFYSLRVTDGRVEWYGKEWKMDLDHPKRASMDDGRSFSSIATVCDEIWERVKADESKGKR